MNDIRPPKRPITPPPQSVAASTKVEAETTQQPMSDLGKNTELTLPRKKRPVLKWLIGVIVAIAIVLIGAAVSVFTWYQDQLKAIQPSSTQKVRVVVEAGMGPEAIAHRLNESNLIKSPVAFEWYVKLANVEGSLQAGIYTLGQSMSVPDIVSHLTSGRTETFTLTFYPGATLRDETDKENSKKIDVVNILLRAGYSESDITKALEKKYDHPLFVSKPASADLEGYIYGETYQFSSSATVEQILERTFDEMYKVIQDNKLVEKYKKRGLSLYEGITLASIVQREDRRLEDQKIIAGVFYNRLDKDISLGSDPTYQYIADKTGQIRDPALDSPYNTRKVKGLPPGPISAPGETALIAVGEPTKTDYLFFVSGDDDKTYFGKTQAEHEANVRNHCQEKCKIL